MLEMASSWKPRALGQLRFPQLFLLLLLEDLLVFCERPHTLRYDFTILSQEGSGRPQFLALGYLDDELFLRYDGDSRRAQPRGLGMKGHVGAETWAQETEVLQKKEQQLRRVLAEVVGHHRHHSVPVGAEDWDSKVTGPCLERPGLHSLQATLGCGFQGNLSTGGFYRLGYNGQDFLVFDLETLRWKLAEPSDHMTKVFRADLVKTFLNHSCPAQLRRHLASISNHLPNTGPPKVIVTRRNFPVGRITLKCQAFNLYPPITTLTWLQDGEPVQRHTSRPGAILPSGDGTYQTWVSIRTLPGEEPRFSCLMQHDSHTTRVPAVFGHRMKITGDDTNTAAALPASALPAVLVMLLTWA